MNFTNNLGFLALLGIPVILLLYVLKQRFKTHEVGSMSLWNKVLEQSDGHKWRQKLRKNILMFLQIGAVILVALALARPFISHIGQRDNMILVLDASMSMQATDENPSRFQKAKSEMTEIIQNSKDGTYFTVVALDDVPYVLTTLTQEKTIAVNAVNSIDAKETGADSESLKTILGSLEAKDTASIYLFTDKNYDLGIEGVTTVVYGNGGNNYAINLMNENEGYVLAKVSSYNGGESCNIALFADGVILDSKEVVFTDKETMDVVFDLQGVSYGYLTAKIMDEDVLEADNVFSISGTQTASRKALLITSGNIFLEKAVSLMEGIDLYKGDSTQMENLSGYDLYIFDGVLPETVPTDGHLWILDPDGDNPYIELTEKQEINQIYFPGNPFSENIEKLDFAVDNSKTGKAPLWSQTIINSDKGALAVYGEYNGQKICIFTFDLHDTQLPLLKEFPILVYNIMNTFIPQKSNEMKEFYAGETTEGLTLLPKAVSATILSPSGKSKEVEVSKGIKEVFYETGVYTLVQNFAEGEKEESYFAVNPVTTGESNLETGISLEGNTEKGGIKTGKSLTPIIILILLLVLAVEWWVNWRDN